MTKSADLLLTNALVLSMDDEMHHMNLALLPSAGIASWRLDPRQTSAKPTAPHRPSIAAAKC